MASAASSEALERGAGAQAPVVAPIKKNKARPYLILGGILAVAAAGYGIYAVTSRGKENTDDAQVDADVVAVSTRVSGAVLDLHVTDNQQVTKDQPLVDIDPADYAARVKEAEAELAAATAQAQAADAQMAIVEATSKGGLSFARAQLSGSATSVASADSDVAAAKAAVTRAEAQASQADVDRARNVSLLTDLAIPRALVDAARSASSEAHAAVAQAQAQLAAAQDMKRTAQTRIAESAARVEQSAPVDAQLASAHAQADLAHARTASAEAALALAKLQLVHAHRRARVRPALATSRCGRGSSCRSDSRSSRSSRPPPMSSPTSRRRRSARCAPGRPRRLRSTRTAAERSWAGSIVRRRELARASRCSRRTTPQATS